MNNRARFPGVMFVALALAASLGQSQVLKKTDSIQFREHLIKDKYGYGYGIAAADLDGDGKLDLTSADTTNNVLYWFANDGRGNFTRHIIAEKEEGWLERHVVGDINGDGRPDVAIVKNLQSQLVWFENPGNPRKSTAWKRHLIAKNFSRAYDVVLADLAGNGRLDVAGSNYVGNRSPGLRTPASTMARNGRNTCWKPRFPRPAPSGRRISTATARSTFWARPPGPTSWSGSRTQANRISPGSSTSSTLNPFGPRMDMPWT
jgi:hypothetical protein